jgi:thioredoxin-related protein
MIRLFGFLLLGGTLAGPVAAEGTKPESLEPGMMNPGYEEKPAWFKSSFLDIREDIAEASADGKRTVLYFYQDGCPYCKKLLEENFGQRAITDKTRDNFDVIAINIWGDREVTSFDGETTTEKQFAESLRVMFTPTMLFLDEQGKVVLRVNGYYAPHKFIAALDYVSGKQEVNGSFREYFVKANPQPAKGDLHQEPDYLKAPFDLAGRDKGRPLVVMFEQKHCTECDELHLDILKRPESKALLSKFDVALMDMWSATPVTTPDGKQMKASEWAKKKDVKYAPSMIFFDGKGREVFRTEAYLKAFHVQSALDYVASGAYLEQPQFQRFIQVRANALEAQGIHVDLMN